MKTPVYINYSLRLVMVCTLVLFICSCQKTEKMQTFNDVFDTSGIENLNAKFTAAKSLDDLPLELTSATFAIPQSIKNITPGEIAAWYKQNNTLTDAEVDMLLKNDSKTYIDVINRLASLPSQIGSLKASDFQELKASDLNGYLLKQINEPDNFYSTDYYSAVIALQEYIKIAVIAPMEMAGDHVKTLPPGKGDLPDPPVYILYYKDITLNNIWHMWWTYWSNGTRTKHRGAAGSFPG